MKCVYFLRLSAVLFLIMYHKAPIDLSTIPFLPTRSNPTKFLGEDVHLSPRQSPLQLSNVRSRNDDSVGPTKDAAINAASCARLKFLLFLGNDFPQIIESTAEPPPPPQAIEPERVARFNPHVGFFDVHGRVCERMIVEDLLGSVYPVDPPGYSEILKAEYDLPAEESSGYGRYGEWAGKRG
jgi:hypothetical protein